MKRLNFKTENRTSELWVNEISVSCKYFSNQFILTNVERNLLKNIYMLRLVRWNIDISCIKQNNRQKQYFELLLKIKSFTLFTCRQICSTNIHRHEFIIHTLQNELHCLCGVSLLVDNRTAFFPATPSN